jgi:hypothetical protein
MLALDNRLETGGTRSRARLWAVAWSVVLPCALLALVAACSRPDLGAAEPQKVTGEASSGQVGRAYPSAEPVDSAKRRSRAPSDTTIEDLLKGQTGFCTGVPVPAATLRPDTALGSVPAATPVYCPFPR